MAAERKFHCKRILKEKGHRHFKEYGYFVRVDAYPVSLPGIHGTDIDAGKTSQIGIDFRKLS